MPRRSPLPSPSESWNERGLDGTWHDGLLMDLLVEEVDL